MKWIAACCIALTLDATDVPAQRAATPAPRIVIALEAAADERPTPFYSGLTNIEFAPLSGALRDSAKIGADWVQPEIAGAFESMTRGAVRVVRYHTTTDSTRRSVLDTAGTLDFTRALPLNFERVGDIMVATASLRTGTVAGHAVTVPIQILYADKYEYARFADMRSGHVDVGGKRYAVRVNRRSRNHPFFAVGGGAQFYIDFDADGKFALRASRMVNGKPVAAEEVQPGVPFVLDGIAYEVVSIDSMGTRLTLQRSARATAVAPGFKPPAYDARDLSGQGITLSAGPGTPTLLEFWSTECPFSESVRAALNAFADNHRGSYLWIAMARESSAADVGAFVLAKPRAARIAVGDSATWSRFNPTSATPKFVLLDGKGTVAFVAEGASALPVVTAKLEELMRTTSR